MFLKGEPVKKLSKGTVHVIEFSGTHCAPCITALPHLTELQKKHPNVIFISVYSQEKKEDVRQFLDQHGEKMGFRVALDRDGAMWKKWMEASGFHGIPYVYLVGADGKIAWIGGPMELDAPLQNVVAGGTINLRRERMLLYFDQADVVANTTWNARCNRSDKAGAALREQLMKHQWAEQIRICEQAARDFPENEFHFLSHKLYALSHNPRTTDEALKFAAELSARMPYSFDRYYGKLGRSGPEADDGNANIAQYLVDQEANDDPLLAEAATILLVKAEEALVEIKDEDKREEQKDYVRWISAMTAAKKQDFATAAALTRESLNWLSQNKNPGTTDEDRKEWEADHLITLKERQDDLARYEKAAAQQGKKP